MKNSEFKRDDCSGIAPFLMELFDGEADEEAARRARAHLLVCQNCARAWFDWNSQRTILRSERVPAPPPTLFWRILLACRLETKRQHAAKRAWYWPFGRAVQAEATPKIEGAPLRGFEPHLAPTDLSARILAQTTRKAAPAERFAPIAPTRTRFRLPALPAFAAPALAAWLLVFQFNTLQSFTVTQPPVAVEPSPVTVTAEPTQKAVKTIKTLKPVATVRKSVAVSAPKTEKSQAAPVVEAESPVREAQPEARPVVRHHEERKVVRPVVEAEPREVIETAPSRLVRRVEWRPQPTEREAAPKVERAVAVKEAVTFVAKTPVAKAVEVSAPKPTTSNVRPTLVAASAASRPMPMRLAELSLDDVETVRARPARLSKFAVMPRRAVPNKFVAASKMRVSQPIATTDAIRPVSTAPVVDESQIEEMRDVVDSYRASLSDDDAVDSSDVS